MKFYFIHVSFFDSRKESQNHTNINWFKCICLIWKSLWIYPCKRSKLLLWEISAIAGKDIWKFSYNPLLDVLNGITCIWNALGYHPSGAFYKHPKIMDFVPYVIKKKLKYHFFLLYFKTNLSDTIKFSKISPPCSKALCLWNFSFYDFKLGKEMRCMGLTKIIINARDLLPKLRILNIRQFGNENGGSCTSFRINSTRFQSSATHFYPSKSFEY